MEAMPKLDRDAFVSALQPEVQAILSQVADAINNAPDGAIVAGSEEQVRDLFAKLRQQAFQKALQMRVDAAQAAFSPSQGTSDW